METETNSQFLLLPSELRDRIYEIVLKDKCFYIEAITRSLAETNAMLGLVSVPDGVDPEIASIHAGIPKLTLALSLACRQIYHEIHAYRLAANGVLLCHIHGPSDRNFFPDSLRHVSTMIFGSPEDSQTRSSKPGPRLWSTPLSTRFRSVKTIIFHFETDFELNPALWTSEDFPGTLYQRAAYCLTKMSYSFHMWLIDSGTSAQEVVVLWGPESRSVGRIEAVQNGASTAGQLPHYHLLPQYAFSDDFMNLLPPGYKGANVSYGPGILHGRRFRAGVISQHH